MKYDASRYDFALFGFFSDVIAIKFFAPSDESYDDDGVANNMGGEIDTSNLVRSFAVYGGGEFICGGTTIS